MSEAITMGEAIMSRTPPFDARRKWRDSLGAILLKAGAITRDQLLVAVSDVTRDCRKMLGQVLVDRQFVTAAQLEAALEEQRRRRGCGLEYQALAQRLVETQCADLDRLQANLDDLRSTAAELTARKGGA